MIGKRIPQAYCEELPEDGFLPGIICLNPPSLHVSIGAPPGSPCRSIQPQQ
jgi:hypothetical protein